MRINLICFPYAGGNKNCYVKYVAHKNLSLNLITIEYPGRGSRSGEKLLFDINSVVNDACNQSIKYIDNGPYAIYGHSMGALVGYLVAKEMIKRKAPPSHLFFSGRSGPSINLSENLHKLNRIQLIDKLKEFGGSHQAILESKAIMDICEPIIRADFSALASYEYIPSEIMDIPMTVICGDRDSIPYEGILNWQNETSCKINIKKMKGKHFFIFDNAAEIMKIINENLLF